MTRILVLLTSPLTAGPALSATACFTAQTGPAEIELLYPRPETDPDFMPTEEVYTEAQRKVFEAEQDNLVSALAHEAASWHKAGLPPLKQVRGKVQDVAAQAAEKADIVILGAPHGDVEARALLETLLFQCMKPVLLVPRTMPRSFGQCIAIAWEAGNGPAKRAVDAVSALLLAAPRTIILIGDEGAHSSAPPDNLMQMLSNAGRPAGLHHFSLASRHIGEALLSEAREVGADLLVMGAFSHGRLREFCFGGATIEILKDLDMPVLMHH
ncbi:universal stress protein [Acidocella sp.]|uniref:universal stress protein n=1 Tax=Acidocella sp. TaxID=50710 RepID=UPI003CFC312E